MPLRRLLLLTFVCLAAAWGHAQVIVSTYVETGNLPRNDDDHSGAVSLGFSMTFGGASYSEVYVSNNGYITFGSGSGNYTAPAFDANYNGLPIIAAFFSDVDTSNEQTGLVSWGTGLVDGRSAFVAKWDSVGEYPNGASPNTFSLTLVSRSDLGAGSFDLYFSYDTITWDHGGATAGFHTATTGGQYYQLPGSLTAGAFLDSGAYSLVELTNSASSGTYLIQSVDGTFLAVAEVVPEPATWLLLGAGAVVLAVTVRRRRRI